MVVDRFSVVPVFGSDRLSDVFLITAAVTSKNILLDPDPDLATVTHFQSHLLEPLDVQVSG
ncbi:MAG: hypothetical protein D6698_15480 [Gammaproteobacteria bacterium]|nr:MAG: hypothetical protein D6698_15480 [Gammaproteobacteria bacterium]